MQQQLLSDGWSPPSLSNRIILFNFHAKYIQVSPGPMNLPSPLHLAHLPAESVSCVQQLYTHTMEFPAVQRVSVKVGCSIFFPKILQRKIPYSTKFWREKTLVNSKLNCIGRKKTLANLSPASSFFSNATSNWRIKFWRIHSESPKFSPTKVFRYTVLIDNTYGLSSVLSTDTFGFNC